MRREEGFTLIEVLVTLIVGLVIFGGALTMMGVSFNSGYGVIDKTEAMQRGRLALDQIERELRSQVCLDATTPAVQTATDTSIRLWVDYSNGDGTKPPALHTLRYDDATHRITDTVGTATRTLLERAYVPSGAKFLTYWAYPDDTTVERAPSVQLSSPVTNPNTIAAIDLAFEVRPTSAPPVSSQAGQDLDGTLLRDHVAVRDADPNRDDPDPSCT